MSGRTVLLVLTLLGRAALSDASTVVNSCSSSAEQLCDFVCDCGDCSDENQCGYLGTSLVLGTPFTCDFEEGDCGWRDVSASAYRWVLGRASLAAWGTGPHSDHTVGTDLGWFMAAADPPGKTSPTAWLRSPVMREAAATCEIRAWYHLSGSGLNRTEQPVLRLALEAGDETVELWQSPEQGGEGWHELVAYPGRTAGSFQLTFSVTPSPAREAQLALDDITFRNCGLPQQLAGQVCEAEESACQRGSCVASDRFCDGTDDCGDGSDEAAPQCESFTACTFEQGLCLWEAEAGPAAWERNASVNLGAAYGLPARDHSNGSREGCFLHVGGVAGGVARLSSPDFQATNSCSLALYCHLHGSAASNLSIYYVTASAKVLLRERTGELGASWVRERVEFDVPETFKVLIEGVAGGTGTVALDDMILSPGCKQEQEKPQIALPDRDAAGPCGAEEFACDSGQCIGAELACDFAEGCADGSDEKRCGATTFEEGAGGWHDLSVGQLRWGVQTATASTGSTLGEAGAFLALQSGAGQTLTAAKARTPPLGPSGPACTMEMSYRISSDHQGFLAVRVADHGTGTTQLAWEARGHGSTAWQHTSIPLGERARPFQVELLGQVNPHEAASVAIDNVTFVHCDPSVAPPQAAEVSCNFETDTCGWYQDQRSDFRWVRGAGQGQGPDHTTGSGYFLAMDPAAPGSHGQQTQLITSYQEPATTASCLSFWYRLAGPQIGTLSLKLKHEEEEETVLWTKRGAQGSVWHRGFATLSPEGQRKYRLAFEALRDGFVGDVGLDDVTLRAGSCGAQRSCSFEAGTCGLAASGELTWLRQSNSTGATAGPSADHTTSTAAGHYMLVNTSKGSLPAGRVAVLTSELYEPSAQTQCLTFWYQLSGATPGSLSVFVEESGMQRRKLFAVSAMQGSAWHHGQVTIQADEDWRAIFEAAGGGGDHAYIALDDLHVMDSACSEPGSCDFELDTCGWSSPTDDNPYGFAWGRKSGVPLAKYPGPEQDHTLGTKDGHYAYFDASVLGLGDTAAQLESQHLPAAADSCLRFWYHMDIPEHLPGVELRVRLHSAEGQRTVWSAAGHQGWGWLSSTVPVQSPSEFQIVFEIATRTWPIKGTIALDDIVYSAGTGCDASAAMAGKETKSSSSFVAEVVIGLLLALVVLAMVVAGGYYLLKRRGQASRTAAESSAPQGFDNITFQDDKVTISPLPKEGE
ncbi:apical endosomal glycoprotein [Dromaius novaehollandiae]|uniref:apical endosomal glycoprotein n=1 Tax=Dromaius novaehollandiae TaxID=8790 RepID=UPI00311DAE6A